MAAGVGSNNIYPPVVSPFAPNFIIGSAKGCRVYFSISAYNSISEYKDIHITITRQSDNITALNKNKYPSQIMIKRASAIQEDSERASADKYYITISNDDIQGGFKTGIVYKVQMRFSNNASGLYATPQKLDAYLTANLSAFSEWSQVCLVQGINKPELQIKSEQGGTLSVTTNNIFSVDTLEIVGTLITDDSDPLREYELLLYDRNYNLIETSGILFPSYQSYKDQLNYIFKTELQDGEEYKLEVKYMTYGLYEDSIQYPILILLNMIEILHCSIDAEGDYENGRIGVNVTTNIVAPFTGLVTIRRTSSKSNFKLWEDVYTNNLRLESLNFSWYDYTVESGVWYKYCIQKRDERGNRGIVVRMEEPVMIEFDDIFLVADNQQIRIQFNPEISTFQRVVNDTKLDTLGSKYPQIRRNGATNYRQFQLNGLISFLMDDYNLFLSREEYYGENLELYKEYNDKNRIDDYIEVTWERDYREKIMDFLYKHNVKLYKSATEGNILVKLTDISFTPNKTLGRRIYSFSCTATEIAENTTSNIDYYSIQEIDKTKKKNSKDEDLDIKNETSTHIGQWIDMIPAGQEFVHASPQDGLYSVLEEYYNKMAKQDYCVNIESLDYLRIEMQDDPYLIIDYGTGEPQDYEAAMGGTQKARSASMRREENLYLGYLAYINGKTIVIPQDGIYELKGSNVEITSLSFARDTIADIQYHAKMNQIENIKKILSLTNFNQVIGQEWGGFIPGSSLYQTLWDKYYSEHPGNYYTALVSINGLRCEANTGTVIYVREEGENIANRHILGETQSIDFYSDDTLIADAYFLGVHFEQATDYEMGRAILPEGKCNKTDIVIDSLDKIIPQDRHIYYLQSSNNEVRDIVMAAIHSTTEPELVKLTTAKGLPIYTLQKETDERIINIAIVDSFDIEELTPYLNNLKYKIFITDTILFTNEQQIKVATSLDNSEAFEFVIDNEENKSKIEAYKTILNQYGDKQITIALKRQIWKDIEYNISDYYIYYNENWYVFDEDTNDAVCPVPASIDYICETMKAYYRNGGRQ